MRSMHNLRSYLLASMAALGLLIMLGATAQSAAPHLTTIHFRPAQWSPVLSRYGVATETDATNIRMASAVAGYPATSPRPTHRVAVAHLPSRILAHQVAITATAVLTNSAPITETSTETSPSSVTVPHAVVVPAAPLSSSIPSLPVSSINPTLLVAPTPAPLSAPAPAPSNRPTVDLAQPSAPWLATENFLILGTDRRGNEGSWRTDVIMLVGLDRAAGRAAVFSIPRDLYVQIPNYGWGRINQVDYLGEKVLQVEGGGPALVSAVLEQNIGVATEHWMRVEMQGLNALVDAIGGVTVHLDCPFYEPIFNLDTNQWDYFTLPAGDVLLDGESAQWFVRLRLRESDIGRSNRQRQFLWALRNQIVSTEQLTRLPELWSALQNMFTTDLTLLDMVDLARIGVTLDADSIRSGGLTLRELQGYQTAAGASVLRIGDPYAVRAVVDGVWDAAPMAAANGQDAEACRPAPAGAPVIPDSLVGIGGAPQPTPEPADAASADEGAAPEAENAVEENVGE